jgi:hypothetical protein
LEALLKGFNEESIFRNHKGGLRFQPIRNIPEIKTQGTLKRRSGRRGIRIGYFIIFDQGLNREFADGKDGGQLAGRDKKLGIGHSDNSLKKKIWNNDTTVTRRKQEKKQDKKKKIGIKGGNDFGTRSGWGKKSKKRG